jgi:thiol-disulfide isomerase/thioredoxin
MKTIVLLAGIALLVCGCDAAKSSSGGSGSSSASTIVAYSPPRTADVTLQYKNYDELQQLIASKKGKIVVVDAWSTYCEPCLKEFPGLVAMHKKYGPEKVACISLCTNYTGVGKPEDEAAEPLKFLKQQGAAFDNVLSTEGSETLYKKMDFFSVPTIFVYGADGKLAKTFDTEPTYQEIDAYVATLVK